MPSPSADNRVLISVLAAVTMVGGSISSLGVVHFLWRQAPSHLLPGSE